MLKLMRLESTSTFAVVDDEKFEKDVEVLGYVRMNYKDGCDFIKIDGAHNEEWFVKLYKAIEEKKQQLFTEIKYRIADLDLENIVIQYLRVKGVRQLS